MYQILKLIYALSSWDNAIGIISIFKDNKIEA